MRRGAQHHRVHHAEDRRVRADGDCKHRHCDDREAWRLAQVSRGDPHVLGPTGQIQERSGRSGGPSRSGGPARSGGSDRPGRFDRRRAAFHPGAWRGFQCVRRGLRKDREQAGGAVPIMRLARFVAEQLEQRETVRPAKPRGIGAHQPTKQRFGDMHRHHARPACGSSLRARAAATRSSSRAASAATTRRPKAVSL